MRIAGIYSFNDGERVVKKKYAKHLQEVQAVIASIDARKYKTKTSKEETRKGKRLFSPSGLNAAIKREFSQRDNWAPVRVKCDYPTNFYVPGYEPKKLRKGAFREIDFVKDKLGVEVQFGKYSFMVYNVAAKMTIFRNLGHINAGIEIVPVKAVVDEMSSGVSYFEQFVWDLEQRGKADIDIPVLILGIDLD